MTIKDHKPQMLGPSVLDYRIAAQPEALKEVKIVIEPVTSVFNQSSLMMELRILRFGQ